MMLTVTEIVERMASQAEEIAKYLLPNGRMEGREWVVGSINGEAGRSLKVCISGGKVGIWSDFAAGNGGDLLDLWRLSRGLPDNKSTLAEVKNYLGIREPEFEKTKAKKYRRPDAPKGAKRPAGESKVFQYLTQERMLTPETIATYRIGEIAQVGPWDGWKKQEPARGPWIVFPFLRGDELLGVKYLHLHRKEGKKFTLVEAGCEPTCFGWHVVNPASRELVICEGEIDAASLYQYGYPAVSVPFGGGKGDKQQWVSGDWEYLEPYETIYLCMDSDKEGEAATEELIQRLGIHRCKIVTLPRKDANQCLMDGITKAEIDSCFDNAKVIEPEELKRANHYTQDVINEFYPAGGKQPGFDMPWEKLPFRFLRGEVTLVNGINGHGKSLCWGQVLLNGAVTAGERCCIASMEMHPRKTLYRLIRQSTGKRVPGRDEITSCLDWMSDKIWLFGMVGTAKTERLLQVFEYAFRRFGVKQFLIDSLMKCGLAEDDYKGQKAFLEHLCDFAQRTGAHVHLVVHPRKGESEHGDIGKMDIKGTGAISDLAFNSFTIWRNKKKEQILRSYRNGEQVELQKGKTISDYESDPDAVLLCDKSRNVDDAEGKYALWFDGSSMQFLEKIDSKVTRYFKTSAQELADDAPF